MLSTQVWWYWVREVKCYFIQRKLVGKRTKWEVKQLLLFTLLRTQSVPLTGLRQKFHIQGSVAQFFSSCDGRQRWIKCHVSHTQCNVTGNVVPSIQKLLQLAKQSSRKQRTRTWCCNTPYQASVHCSLCTLSTGDCLFFWWHRGFRMIYISSTSLLCTEKQRPEHHVEDFLFLITAPRQNLLYMLCTYEQHYYAYTLAISGDGWASLSQTRKLAFLKPVHSILPPSYGPTVSVTNHQWNHTIPCRCVATSLHVYSDPSQTPD